MEKEILSKMTNDGMSISEISKAIQKSNTTVRYWLNKFGFKTKNLSFSQIGVIDYCGEKKCPRCNQVKKESEFYQRRGKIAGSVYCKVCTNLQTVERQRALKSKAIEYKGGSCVICGYSKCNSALEFHHLDPKEKDFSLGEMKQSKWTDEIKKELDKCILVCSNCHREIHSKI